MPKLPLNYENWLYQNKKDKKPEPDYDTIADDMRDDQPDNEND